MNELEPLARLATLGTARVPQTPEVEGLAGRVLHALEAQPLERRVLLAAGARSVARAAARPLGRLEHPPHPAPPETLQAVP